MKRFKSANQGIRYYIGWIIFVFILVSFLTFILLKTFLPKKIDNLADLKNNQQTTTTESSENSSNETKEIETSSSQTEDKPESTNPENKTPLQNDPVETESSSDNSLGASINYLSVDHSSDNFRIRVTINQLLSSRGECILNMVSKNGDKITKTVPTENNPHSATCQGFDIPLHGLNPGEYQINLTINADNKTQKIQKAYTI